jgi:hypothetical protein
MPPRQGSKGRGGGGGGGRGRGGGKQHHDRVHKVKGGYQVGRHFHGKFKTKAAANKQAWAIGMSKARKAGIKGIAPPLNKRKR